MSVGEISKPYEAVDSKCQLCFKMVKLRARTEPHRANLFFFNDTATTEIYTLSYTLSLPDALPISRVPSRARLAYLRQGLQSGSFRYPATGRSEEHTSELQSHSESSYAVFRWKKKKKEKNEKNRNNYNRNQERNKKKETK